MTALGSEASWFPDIVARWYDEYSAGAHDQDDYWRGSPTIVSSWLNDFIADPHRAASRLDSWVARAHPGKEQERRYRALQVASAAIAEVGFQIEARNDAKAWRSLQHHRLSSGNLLRHVQGLLLPVEKKVYPWFWRSNPLLHAYRSHRSHFDSFVRWDPSRHPEFAGLKIRVTVLPRSLVPCESLERQLKVAIVPLVPSTADFEWHPTETAGRPSFRVSLRDPGPIITAALEALKKAAAASCDIVVFPELCLTPEAQKEIGAGLFANPKKYPWLVVAGSAPTPAPAQPGAFHNRAIVFNGQGCDVLQHHKLHRYEISRREQDRYGLADVFDEIDRLEDIAVAPFELEVLDTAIGRIAVVICEDLSAVELLEPLVSELGLDWLLAPVLDGSQTRQRWTARLGERYAERGTALVVATSLGLVSQHCRFEAEKVPPNPIAPHVGLVVRPTLHGAQIDSLPPADGPPPLYHAEPVVIDLVTP
jgi:predicted amidohydrolase